MKRHRRTKADVLHDLRREAKRLYHFYGLPIYLVGSALIDANERPRDWDLRVRMPDKQFLDRFGIPLKWIMETQTGDWTDIKYKWSDECVKRSQQAGRACQALVDFQIYPACYWRTFRRLPRRRLA